MKPISDILTEIPDLALEAWLTWGTSPISDEGKRGGRGPRIAAGAVMPDYTLADLDRLVALSGDNNHDGLGVLSSWVRSIHGNRDEQGHADDWPADSAASACSWLAERLDWISLHPWLTEGLHDDLRRLHSTLRVVCKVRPEYAPHCRRCNDVVHLLDGDGQRAAPETFAYGSCAGCGETYPKGPAMDALGRLQDFTLAELADRVKVPLSTLHRWHKEGLIKPTGKSPAGKTFRVGDVMSVKLTMGRSAA